MMKSKFFKISMCIALIALMLVGCKNNNTDTDNMSDQPVEVNTEIESIASNYSFEVEYTQNGETENAKYKAMNGKLLYQGPYGLDLTDGILIIDFNEQTYTIVTPEKKDAYKMRVNKSIYTFKQPEEFLIMDESLALSLDNEEKVNGRTVSTYVGQIQHDGSINEIKAKKDESGLWVYYGETDTSGNVITQWKVNNLTFETVTEADFAIPEDYNFSDVSDLGM